MKRALLVACCLLPWGGVALAQQQATSNRQQTVAATVQPAQPTVGDHITLRFQGPVVLEASPHYEIVSQRGNRVVVRTFEPKPFALSGRTADVRFQNLVVPVRSVLTPGDDLQPAPLKPPHPVEYPRLPAIAMAIAGGIAAAAWLAAWLLARRKRVAASIVEQLDPADRFRAAVASSRSWADLADATRRYLASLSPHLGVELTTTQLLARVDAEHIGRVAVILRQGDLEKFSPWGAPAADFESIANSALSLIPPEPEEQAA